jgi:uncharacterized protein (TIGR03435 family)
MKQLRLSLLLLATASIALVGPIAFPQQNTPNKSAPSSKPIAFDVVSIRPSGLKSEMGWQFLSDGYRATNVSLMVTILNAYFPLPSFRYGNQVKGAPAWVMNEHYDIEAKIAPADIAEWDRLRNTLRSQNEMLQAMLQAALAERCKLAAHHVSMEVDGHVLIVGKHGPKLKDAKPGEELPVGMKLPDGAVAVGSERGKPLQWTFHHASMESLRSFLTLSVEGTLENRTGLTGNYDFVLSKRQDYVTPEVQTAPPDLEDFWDMEALGLEVKQVKLPGEVLIIDHIERPSEN